MIQMRFAFPWFRGRHRFDRVSGSAAGSNVYAATTCKAPVNNVAAAVTARSFFLRFFFVFFPLFQSPFFRNSLLCWNDSSLPNLHSSLMNSKSLTFAHWNHTWRNKNYHLLFSSVYQQKSRFFISFLSNSHKFKDQFFNCNYDIIKIVKLSNEVYPNYI